MPNNLRHILQETFLLTIGDYVIVNNRDYGYVISMNNNNIDIKEKYAITNIIQDSSVYDCHIICIVNNTHHRSGYERHVRTAPHTLPNNITTILIITTGRLTLTPIKTFKGLIQSTRS